VAITIAKQKPTFHRTNPNQLDKAALQFARVEIRDRPFGFGKGAGQGKGLSA
jgi:hypothetical protein